MDETSEFAPSVPQFLLAADNHNIGNTGTSWLNPMDWGDKLGNVGKFAVASVLSGTNSFYNTATTVGSWFGVSEGTQRDTNEWISSFDSDLGQYYRNNEEAVDFTGFVLGSLIPGLGGVKVLNAGQMALKTASSTGFIGGTLGKATGLLAPNTQKFVSMAAAEINQSTSALKLLNVNTTKAIGAGLWQNTLEAAAFETAVQVSMFKSPVLEDQTIGDIITNVAVGGVIGGVIGGAFNTAKIFGDLRKAVKAEDLNRLPFVDRPKFADTTPASERITQLAYDSQSSAVPITLKNAQGELVQNNYAVNKTLYDDKIRKNNNDIRAAINELSGNDTELGNILANSSVGADAMTYLGNFSGAVQVVRATQKGKLEIAQEVATKNNQIPARTVEARYVQTIGENAGQVIDTPPILLSLGDIHQGQKGVLNAVREHGFSPSKIWNALELKGAKAHLESEARHIWAMTVLKEIPDGTTISRYDIPLLERAYKDGKTIKVSSGEGPSLVVDTLSSKEQIWQVLKESKVEVANELLRKMSLDGSIPVEQGTQAAAKIANTRMSMLEGFPAANEFDDFFAYQGVAESYLKSIKDKGLSGNVGEAVDPIFLPKYAKVIYETSGEQVPSNVVDAMAFYKAKQAQYVDTANNVVAKILGGKSESLPDISDTALLSASRNGSGAGLFSFENSNYGTLGSSMAWIGSITRSAITDARKTVGDSLAPVLTKLATKPEAAIEFESINQQITRSGKLWKLDRDNRAMLSVEKEGVEQDIIHLEHNETIDVIGQHIETAGSRTTGFREIRSAQGLTDLKDAEVFRPIRPDLKQYPHFAFVKDPAVTGSGHTTMIHAASEKELAALIDKVPSRYGVVTKTDTEEFFKARGEYEYSRTLHENYIDSDLANRGIFSNFFPKSDPDKIVNDVLQQHYRESDTLVREAVRLRYEPQFGWLEDVGKSYSKTATSKFASKSELIESSADNPYFNYIKTALDIGKINEHPLIYGFNKMLDEAVSKFSGSLSETFQGIKSSAELDLLNAQLDKYGMKPAYYDSALHVLANHQAPKGVLTSFVRKANSLLSLFTLGLDPLNSVNNAIGANILRMTELRHLTKAIQQGNTELAGELGSLARVSAPGTGGDSILAPTKLVSQAIQNFWKDDGTLLARYKELGYIKDRVEQLKLLVDDFTLKGTETVAELDQRIEVGFQRAKMLQEKNFGRDFKIVDANGKVLATGDEMLLKAKLSPGQKLQTIAEKGEKLSGNKLAEEFNRFISANVMDQITSLGKKHGLIDEAESKAYINTFVNRVEGNTVASQRPLVFQGPVGQAIGLFQSYQFNLLQQLFRYSAEGSKKDLGMLLGMQSTLYGIQSLPGFQFLNTHILGQMSGNTQHKDAYDAVYGAAGREAGNWMLYGIPSNILQTNIYSRGDINPRQVTVLPTSLQEIPIVQGWGKFLGSMKEMISKAAAGGQVWESILQGVEHNGISRPLAGLAQVLQGVPSGTSYSTSNKGSILYSNDLFALANLSRLAGGRPLDEAITNDALFRVRSYEAANTASRAKLNETIKTALIAGNEPSEEDLNKFAEDYARTGGKQAGFNKYMMGLYKSANVPQAEQIETSLKNPFSYKMQLLMGGDDE